MGKKNVATIVSCCGFIIISLLLIFPVKNILFAQESTCARVKIEIKQELTLERQAFDAHMRINNGLTHTSLENIQVDVWFTDEDSNAVLATSDPDNTDAKFFIRVDSMTNIDSVDGSGSTPADSSSDIHWLIIPAPGTSNGLESGTLYNVGATLTYTVGGEENVIEVNPDYIFVKPMPELTLDYFLPSDVYGDDPFTTEIEPVIPFSLGVRVKNTGAGGAQNLKIDSAQPKIIDNDQGLLINFFIEGSEVNGEETGETLLVDFGTIDPETSAIARWIMNCTLSGKFVDFQAEYSHSDELGGELTSLIDDIKTHVLVQDVLVDLPGRDTIRDFLSRAGEYYKIYESDSTETDVTDQSGSATLSFKNNLGSESHYTLLVPVTAGFMYVKQPDPHNGSKMLKKVIRSDGKLIKPENGWMSKVQDRDTHLWDHFFNLFDVNTTVSYTLVYEDRSSMPQKPVLQYIADKSVTEEQQVSFIVESSDPNGTIPKLSATPLPVGAELIDNGDGTGIFDWVPVQGQKGIYYITFSASDSALSTSRRVKFTVFDINDTDMDGMLDAWEIANFGVLLRDGSGDFDSDGISDLQEFIDETDPTADESVPSVPDPLYPYPNVDVEDDTPELVIENSLDTQNDTIDYEFEIYSDLQMTDMVANQDNVVQMFNQTDLFLYRLVAAVGDVPVPTIGSTTNWIVPIPLPDNARYYWRVRSKDAEGSSLWAYQAFFVNTQNDPPLNFYINSPENGVEVDSLTPLLSVLNSTDIDNDIISYVFEVYQDQEMTQPVESSIWINQGQSTTSWTVTSELSDQTQYFWRVIAADTLGGQTVTQLSTFYVNTTNSAPSIPVISSPDGQTEIESLNILLGIENSTDGNVDPLSYVFEIDTSDKFDTPDKQVSDEILEGIDTTWWQVANLEENQEYHWRVRASDGKANSMWANASFFINQINEASSVPTLKNPGNTAWVDTRTPVLSVHPAIDPDQDKLEYKFEIYSNQTLTHFVVQGDSADPDWTIPVNLRNNTRYYWRAQAIDEHGVPSAWTVVSEFFVSLNLINEVPEIEIIEPFEDLYTQDQAINIQWSDSDPDSSAIISLFYDTDNQGEDGVLIVDNIEEDQDNDQDSYVWNVSALEDGIYYIYALIRDEDASIYRYAPIMITIDRTPPGLSISPEPGNYDEPQSVVITSDETAQIFYTIDGTEPGANSLRYTDPIEISESTILKCMAQDPTGNISEVITSEYLFNPDMVILNVADSNNPIANTTVYVFKESGNYYGTSGKTDAEGLALFDPAGFEPGTYKYRVDYLGNQFWSESFQMPDDMYTELVIPTENVTLDVTTANGPAFGYKVYLFSESGSYLGQYQKTDENGQVVFELPVGVSFKYRADVLGTKYWTDSIPVQSGGSNAVVLETGGGIFTITLQTDPTTPIPGIKMYLFSPSGSYLGKYQKTDANGQVAFEVPEADYVIRADYMGYKFWTDATLVSTDTTMDLTLTHRDVELDVSSVYQNISEPVNNVNVYLFSPSNVYLGKYQRTNENGQVSFSLPDKPYKIRVDYLGQKFWSEEFTSQDTAVNIVSAMAQVSVSGSGLPQSELKVYLFSETGLFLDQYQRTDDSGQVMFRLPEGKYKFRADYEGSQFWSHISELAPDIVNPVDISVGGGQFVFQARTDTGDSISGSKCYVFTENKSYIGLYSATDENGEAFFDLADGIYLFRLDYMGEQFWSEPITIPDQLSYQMALGHKVAQITVKTKNEIVPNTKVYLFSETNQYLGKYQKTNDNGMVSFLLPVGMKYLFRADVSGTHQWSDLVQISDAGTNLIDLDAGGGQFMITLQKDDLTPISGIKMYLFTDTGSYTGQSKKTDAAGQVAFEVPDGDFKIRADYRGYQFWTDVEIITDDRIIDLTLPHYNTQINLKRHYQGAYDPLTGIKMYLFNPSGSYLGQYEMTDTDGNVKFSLPDREYKVRADYMGNKFWTEPFQSLDTDMTIYHGIAQVKVIRSGIPVPNIKTYLFNDNGSYLGQYSSTDENGFAEFTVPANHSYKFRVDVNGQRYWSDSVNIIENQKTPAEVEVD